MIYGKEIQFRPRFAMALAMLRRETKKLTHGNLPVNYSEEAGWYSMNISLGKEEDWERDGIAPGKEESMTAYIITVLIQILSGWGAPSELCAVGRSSAYAQLQDTAQIQEIKEKWATRKWMMRELIVPYDVETAAVFQAAQLVMTSGLRKFYGFGYATIGGPLVYNGNPDPNVFPEWN